MILRLMSDAYLAERALFDECDGEPRNDCAREMCRRDKGKDTEGGENG